MTMPTTEKKPVTPAVADNGLGKRSGEGGGHHRCERGNEAGAGEPAESGC
ncbi:hypothetical protein GCM10027062_24700 [Nocardioides hungaricus]